MLIKTRIVLISLFFSIYVSHVEATTYVWVGATNAWTLITNWNPVGDPNNSADSVNFSTASPLSQPSLNATRSIASILFLTSGYTLTITGASGELDLFSGIAGVSNGNITNNADLVCKSNCSISSLISIAGSGLVAFATSATTSAIYGNLSGTQTFQVNGGAAVSLVGLNTYSGATTVGVASTSAGTLTIGDGTTPGTTFTTSNIALTTHASNALFFNLPSAASLTYDGVISGSGGAVTVQSGTIIVTGNNSYSGTTNLTGGTLQIGNAGTAGAYAGNITLSAAGSIAFNRTNSPTFAPVISGSTSSSSGVYAMRSVTLSGTNTYSGGTQVDDGATLIFSGNSAAVSGTATVNAGGTLQIGTGTAGTFGGNITLVGSGTTSNLVFNRSNASTYAGNISSTGGNSNAVTVQGGGGGNLTLSGTHSYTGTTTLNTGTLTFTGDKTAASGGAITIASGTTLNVGDGTTSGSSFQGAITDTGALVFNIPNANTLTASGSITSTGTVTKSGGGIAILSASSSYTGTTTVSAGTLTFLGDKTAASGGAISIASGATLNMGDGTTSGSSLQGAITDTGALVFNIPNANTLTASGSITSTGTVTKSGGGIAILSASSSYTGTTTVSAGTLTFLGDKTAASGGAISIASGATLNMGDGTTSGSSLQGAITDSGTLTFNIPNATTLTATGTISSTGAVTKLGAGTTILSGASSYTGTTTLTTGILTFLANKTAASGGAVSIASGTTLNVGNGTTSGSSFQGAITDTGALVFNIPNATTLTASGNISSTGTVTKSGAGITILSGSNSYTGTTTLSTGTLTFTGDKTAASGGAISIASGTTLNVGDGTTSGSSFQGDITNDGSLNFNIPTSTILTSTGSISSTGPLTKSGAGTAVISGASTYTGSTTVTVGTLTFTANKTAASGGAISIASGATLGVGNGVASGSSFQGDITDDGTVTFNIPTSNTVTASGAITSGGAVTKLGSGTAVLSNNNSYTGSTTVSVGALTFLGNKTAASGGSISIASGSTLNMGNGTTSGSSLQGTITDSGTLAFNIPNATTLTATGTISSTGAVTKSGAGTTILSGVSSYTGTTSLTAGILTFLANKTAASGGAITMASGTTLNVGDGTTSGSSFQGAITDTGALVFNIPNANTLTASGNISSTGTVTKSGGGITILSGSNSYTGTTTLGTGTLTFTGDKTAASGGSVSIASGTTLNVGDGTTSGASFQGDITNGGSLNFNIPASTTLTNTGAISSTGPLTKSGAGTAVISGASTYTGSTTVSVGTLTFTANKTAASGGAISIASGATLGVGDGTNSGSSFQGDITDDGTVTFNIPTSNTVTASGAITSGGTVTKLGSGTAVLSNNNSYTGSTTVSVGTLTFLGNKTAASGGAISIASGATLNMGDGTTSGSSLQGAITDSGTLTFNIPNATTLTATGTISSTGAVTKSGAGTTILSGVSSYTGTTTLTAGILTFLADKTAASGGAITMSSGTTLNVGDGTTSGSSFQGAITDTGALVFNIPNANTLTASGNISSTGTVTKLGGGIAILSGSNSYTGTTTLSTGILTFTGDKTAASGGAITMASGTTLNVGDGTTSGSSFQGAVTDIGALVFNIPNANTLTASGNISSTGTVTKLGAGIAILSGSNSYTGTTTLSTGTLTFTGDKTAASGGAILMASGTTLNVGNGTTSGSSLQGDITNDGTLNFNIPASTTLTSTGAISATGTVTKNGVGTAVISGASTYTGSTTITAGTLTFTGNKTAVSGGAISIASGATLGVGDGTTSGSSFQGDIADDGTLTFNIPTSNTVTASGEIASTGSVTKLGSGTAILSNNLIYTGSTTISVGTLTLLGNKTAASGGAISIATGSTLNIGNGTTSGSSLQGAITDSGTLAFNIPGATTLTATGSISSIGSVTKSGAGTTILSGASGYTGTTTLTTGVLTFLGNKTAASGGAISMASGTTLNVGNGTTSGSSFQGDITNDGSLNFDIPSSTTLTTTGTISATGTLTKSGAGTAVMAGASTYTGSTTVSVGTLTFTGDKTVTSGGSISIASGATLGVGDGFTSGSSFQGDILDTGTLTFNIPTSNTVTASGAITSTGAVTKLGSGTAILSNNNSYTGSTTVSVGTLTLLGNKTAASGGAISIATGSTLNIGNGTTSGSSLQGAITDSGTLAFNIPSATTLTATGNISSSGAVTKSGSGTTILSGASSYTGTTTLSTGVLTFLGDKTATSGGAISIASGATLNVGDGTSSGSSFQGAITNSGALAFSIPALNTVTVTGDISSSGVLIKSNAGTVILSGSSTYTGSTTINAGILTVTGNKTAVSGGSVSIASGATLNVGDGTTTGASSFQGAISNSGSLSFNIPTGGAVTANGAITGAGSLTKSGPGSVVLSGLDSSTGITSVSGGTLTFTNAKLAATGGAVSIANGCTLNVGDGTSVGNSFQGAITNDGSLNFNVPTAGSVATNGAISGVGSLTKLGAGSAALAGVSSYSGTTTVSAGGLTFGADKTGSGSIAIGSSGTLGIGNGANVTTFLGDMSNDGSISINIPVSTTLTVSGLISGTGSLTKFGSGIAVLSSNISYTGTTTASVGTLTILGDKTAVSGGAVSILSGSVLNVGNGTVSGSTFQGVITDSGTLNFNIPTSNTLSVSGGISSSGAVAKQGAGTVVLSANNSYSGTTSISAGTAIFLGNKTGAGSTTIAAGSSLNIGNGTTSATPFQGAITNNGSINLNIPTSNTVAVLGIISSTGTVTKSGGGTAILSGSNTYTGSTTLSAGTLTFTANKTAATGGSISIANGSTLNIGNGVVSGTSFQGNIADDGTLNFNLPSTTTLTYSGNLTGTLGVISIATGTVIFTGDNSAFAGQTIFTGGTLQIGNGGTTGSYAGSMTLSGQASLVFNRSDNPTIAMDVSGSSTGAPAVRFIQSLTFSGTNSYTGSTQIDAGATVVFSGDSSAVSGTASVASSGTLQIGAGSTGALGGNVTLLAGGGSTVSSLVFNRSNTLTYAGVITGGTDSEVKNIGSGTVTISSAQSYTGVTKVNAGTLVFTNDKTASTGGGVVIEAGASLNVGNGTASGSSFQGNITNNGTLTFDIPASNVVTATGVISAAGAIYKTGDGAAVLSANQTYTGITDVSGGTLIFTGNKTATLPGNISISNGSILQIGDGVNSGFLVKGNVSGDGSLLLDIPTSSTTTLEGSITSDMSVTKQGSGIALLVGNHSYTGTTTVEGGNLIFVGNKTVTTGGNLMVQTAGTLSVGNGSQVFSSFEGNINDEGTVNFNLPTGESLIYSNVISGLSGEVDVQSGTIILTGSNTFSGTTQVSGEGVLQIGQGGTTGTYVSDITLSGAGGVVFDRSDNPDVGLSISGSSTGTAVHAMQSMQLSGTNTYQGGTQIDAGATLIISGDSSGVGGTATVASDATLQIGVGNAGAFSGDVILSVGMGSTISQVVFNRSSDLIYSGTISGGTDSEVENSGVGTIILSNAQSYLSTTTISMGEMTFLADKTATSGGTVDIAAGSVLNMGDGISSGSVFAGNITNGGTIDIDIPFGNTLTATGVISSTGGVNKSGYGTVVLTEDNTYTGTTVINTGVLTFLGDRVPASGGTISIEAGATLNIGNGTVAGVLFQGNIINNTATLNVDLPAATSMTYSSTISGAFGSLNVEQGTLILSNTNTFTGTTTVAGTLQLGNGGTTGSYVGDVELNAGSIVFNRSDTPDFNFVIGGSSTNTTAVHAMQSVILSGNNIYQAATRIDANATVVFSGDSSGVVGTATVASGGTLQIGAGSTGEFGGAVTLLSGTGSTTSRLRFDVSNNLTYAQVISGGADTEISTLGTGSITLSQAQSYTGSTHIQAGAMTFLANKTAVADGEIIIDSSATLNVGNGVTSGSLFDGDINNDGNVQFNIPAATALTAEGTITSVGTLTKAGMGTTILTGNNSYTGLTTVNAGTLIFTGNKTATTGGDILIAGNGVLQVGNGTASGSIIVGNITDSGSLTFNIPASTTVTSTGTIVSTGSVSKIGSGTTILTGEDSHTGTTTVSQGTLTYTGDKLATSGGNISIAIPAILNVGDGSNVGTTFQGDVLNNGNLNLNIPTSAETSVEGIVSGSGAVTKAGVGTAVLSNNANYTGSTSVTNGILRFLDVKTGSGTNFISSSGVLEIGGSQYAGSLSDDGTVNILTTTNVSTLSGSGLLDILNSSAVTLEQNQTGTFSGVISGAGDIIKEGSGTLILTGDSSFSGTVEVDEGMLVLGDVANTNASIENSSVTVNEGAVLEGYGATGPLTNAGLVSPGTSIGTLTVFGDYVQSGVLKIEVNPQGQADFLQVFGDVVIESGATLALSGQVAVSVEEGFTQDFLYTFLSADSITGSFANVTGDTFSQGLLIGRIKSENNEIGVYLAFNEAVIGSAAQTANQRSFGTYLGQVTGTAAVSGLFGTIDPSQFPAAADQVGGATYANQQTELGQVASRLTERMAERFSTVCDFWAEKGRQFVTMEEYNYCTRHPGGWMVISGGEDELQAGDVSGLNTTTQNLMAGFESKLGNTLLGVGFGYSHFHENATANESAKTRGDLWQGGLYASYEAPRWFLAATVDAGFTQSVQAERFVEGVSGQNQTKANYVDQVFGEQMRVGYRAEKGSFFRPFLGVVAQQVVQQNFNETTNTGFELALNKSVYYSLRSQLGLEFNFNVRAHPFLEGIWEHEFADQAGEFDARLLGVEDTQSTFHINGQPIGRNMGVIKAGLKVIQRSHFTLDVFYEGHFAQGWELNTGNVALNVVF